MSRPDFRGCAVPAVALLAISSAALSAPGRLPAAPDSTEGRPDYDCGVQALSTLLRLEGCPTGLTRIAACLPAPDPRGYSMKELRHAARACGIALAGVRMERAERAPDRPVLAFLRRGTHGHFLVVRPVGHSGKLVQIIDSARDEPEVLDAATLYASPEWTGLALIPARPDWPARLAAGVVGCGGIAASGWLLTRLRRRGPMLGPAEVIGPGKMA